MDLSIKKAPQTGSQQEFVFLCKEFLPCRDLIKSRKDFFTINAIFAPREPSADSLLTFSGDIDPRSDTGEVLKRTVIDRIYDVVYNGLHVNDGLGRNDLTCP